MRAFLYEVLTQTIILLGRLRERLIKYAPQKVIKERTFDIYSYERWECCDCGLLHEVQTFENAKTDDCGHEVDDLGQYCIEKFGARRIGHMWPVRPASYGYRLRKGAGTPALAKEVS